MTDEVILRVVKGPMTGSVFTFREHDTFVFGRGRKCHACIADDSAVSRHHFVLGHRLEQTGGRRAERYRGLLERGLGALERARKWNDELHRMLCGRGRSAAHKGGG